MDPSSEAAEAIIPREKKREALIEESTTEPEQEPGLSPTLKNVVAGTVGGKTTTSLGSLLILFAIRPLGLAGVVAGHPFDTVKVRLQSQQLMPGTAPVYRGTFQTLLHIYKNEHIFGLFKGMSSPLVGVAVINALLFGVYGFLLDTQQRFEGNRFREPTIQQVFWAGAGSGLINSLISGPTELAKIQLQNQAGSKASGRSAGGGRAALKGPVDCIRQIIRTEGLRGCFRGMWPTILRETPSYGVYFATFECLQKARFGGRRSHGDAKEEGPIGPFGLMMAGGISGVAGWLSTYPIDVVKTKIQAQPLLDATKTPLEPRYRGIVDCMRRSVKAEGPMVLWRGLGATIIRAFPTNAVIFLAYSTAIDLLERDYPTSSSPS